ncbi:Telomerase reverse transcriptase [Pseudogymnoascus australis]
MSLVTTAKESFQIVDFAVWLLFNNSTREGTSVKHLLCQGFSKVPSAGRKDADSAPLSAIRRMVPVYPNKHYNELKVDPWPQVLGLLGKGGDRVMIDLLVDCGIFLAVVNGRGNYYVLNRYSHSSKSACLEEGAPVIHPSTLQVMKYIFPKQFGLHNVFNSVVDFRETVHPFKDYTLREDEIRRLRPNHKGASTTRMPRRLRGSLVSLVQKLQILHERCPYGQMIAYYCPLNALSTFPAPSTSDASRTFQTQKPTPGSHSGTGLTPARLPKTQRKENIMDLACPSANVSAFCRAVLGRVIPDEFLGIGEDQTHNKQILMKNMDRFVDLRRFETLSLHDAVQGMKISAIPWLNCGSSEDAKGSQSDTRKRWEMFYEFMYYIFDSLIIPLIRCNFHVTESGVHRYRIFYFRQDVWRNLAEPAMASLKQAMFEEVDMNVAKSVLDSRTIGFSQIRLLPKEKGVRPVLNLRRRQVRRDSKRALGPSINSTLAPVYNMLTFEKNLSPAKFGSTLFSVGDLYNKIKEFAEAIKPIGHPLYFCKVDVQAAFDTIPQAAAIKLISGLPTSDDYQISKHVEVKPGDGYRHGQSKPIRKWTSLAWATNDRQPFDLKMGQKMTNGKNTIFTENLAVQSHSKDQLLSLLSEHVQRNLVKIGKKFHRQKKGIPQGSVISSLLCNYFYADLETKHLSFLNADGCLLLRLIDDFLLITIDPEHARRFIQTMHDGLPDYGVSVNPEKTLVNFEASINGQKVKRLVKGQEFPYCGTFINTNTLHITKDRERYKDLAVVDSLTVEFSKTPGKTFHRKVLNSFKIQCHAMFMDTTFNSLTVVARNIFESFVESANKMCAYSRCLPTQKQPSANITIRTIGGLVDLAFVLIKSKEKNPKNLGYRCAISKTEIRWLALRAFHSVLKHRQSKYREELLWLDGELLHLTGGRTG